MPAAAPSRRHRPRPALRQLRGEPRVRRRCDLTLPSPADGGRMSSISCARCPAATAASAQAAVRAQPGARRPGRAGGRRATRSPCFRRWPEAEHGLPHRRDPIDLAALLAAVQAPERGGVAAFVGPRARSPPGGRAVLRLDYSAYGPMAEAECARIVAEAERAGRWRSRSSTGSARSRSATRPWPWWPRRRTGTRPSPPAAT